MEGKLYKIDEVISFIKEGKLLSLAGDEKILSQLPKGNWIGGTIPYFMGDEKAMFSQDLIFANEFDSAAKDFKIKTYGPDEVNNIVTDTYENVFSFIIIPPFTKVHENYALQIPENENVFNTPIVGWVAGFDLNSQDTAKVFNGQTGEVITDKAVVIHVELPEHKTAYLEIVNIFEQSENSPEIEFLESGFSCKECLINGEKTNFAQYLRDNNIDIKLPIISDYAGAQINVSFRSVEDDTVNFYAPVFKDRIYKFAKPINNYVSSFNFQIKQIENQPKFSCNCILNYLYGELEGKKIDKISGPITFGEIAYLLLNQTLTLLYIEDK